MTVKAKILDALGKFWSKLKTTYVTNCAATSDNLALAASQGKVLQDQITELNSKRAIRATLISNDYFSETAVNRCYLVTCGKIGVIKLNLILDLIKIPYSTADTYEIMKFVGVTCQTPAYVATVMHVNTDARLTFTCDNTNNVLTIKVSNYCGSDADLGFYRAVIPVILE